MHDTNRLVKCLPAVAMGLWPSFAWAQGAEMTSPVAIGIAAFLITALISALLLAFHYRRRLGVAETCSHALSIRATLMEATSSLRSEHAIIWPFYSSDEIVGEGFGTLLGVEAANDGWYAALSRMMTDQDSSALDDAVAALRDARKPFAMQLSTADQSRNFSIRGDCILSADGGAAALLVGERSVDAARIDRLSSDARQMHLLFDALPLPVWMRGPDLSLKYANQAYRRAVEAVDDFPVERLPEIAAGSGPQGGRAVAERARAANRPESERQHIVVEGSRRLVDLVEMPLDGTKDLAGFAIDLTQLEDVQAELSRHIAGHEEILQNLGTAIAIFGRDQSLQFFNNAYLQLWGLDEAWLRTEPRMAEILEELRDGRRLPEYADFPAFKNEQLRLFTSLIDPVEEMVHLPDGTTLRSVAIPHPFGGLLMVWEDVTDTLALERNYNTLIAVQRETLDNLYEGVAVIGANGRLRLTNPVFGSMWQISSLELANEPHISEIVDRMAEMLEPTNNWREEKERMIGVLTDREPHNGRIERTDRTVVDFATVPLPDGAVLLSYIDVTASINMERALRERNEALETADILKSEFIANVSYELRTPLNTIIGFTEILSGEYFGELNNRQSEYTSGILDSSNRLLMLINDILDLATIEAGHMSLELNTIDVGSMLNSVLSLVRERARQKKLHLECDCPPDIGMIVADDRRLKQALFNILSNAVKFTPENGNVVVSARRQGDEIVLTTTDSGIGISAEDQERVFDRFERGSHPDARRAGAGLGLSLVKSFVEMHGGWVAIESQPDSGTSVMCTLPARAVPSPVN
ncbi:MAG: signal transduction histidine kinase [Alphaproteobacteria bacterium]|jgi:signal transduction histidine kinase